MGNASNKLCRWVDTFCLLNVRNNSKITLLAFLNSWTPGPTLEHWWGSLWKSLDQKINFSISARYTTSLLLCLWSIVGDQTVDNHCLSPILSGGWEDGTGDILGCIHVCTEKEVGLEGGGFVIVTRQIPGGKFLACLCGRISNQSHAAAPLLPSPGNPINCVRQRELVSIDPYSAALWLADKGHSHVETNARTEQPGGGPVPTSLLPSSPMGWSCSGLITICMGADKTGNYNGMVLQDFVQGIRYFTVHLFICCLWFLLIPHWALIIMPHSSQ